jgi:REP element-mobilizing transposase RayT
MSRGVQGNYIFLEQDNRIVFMQLLNELFIQYEVQCYAYCLLDNHFHLLIQLPACNLSLMMRSLNGRYTQYFNRQYFQSGALFAGRFKSVVIQKERYLQELARYLVLNPLRKSYVNHPEDYQWSSYRSMIGLEQAPIWLAKTELLNTFSKDSVTALAAFKQYTNQGIRQSFSGKVVQQSYIGDAAFIQKVKSYTS